MTELLIGVKAHLGKHKGEYMSNSVKIYPSDDAYIRDDNGQGDTNFGSETKLVNSNSQTSGNTINAKSFIKWDLSDIPAGAVITEAKFYCYWYSVFSFEITIKISQVTSADWAEGSITWNNAPTITGVLGNWNLYEGVGWFNIDITTLVQDWFSGDENNYGLLIGRPISDTDAPGEARSQEYADISYRPYLEVKYELAANVVFFGTNF